MKVLNLRCSVQHDFEGWFTSEDDFRAQIDRGLVQCPWCGDPDVRKMPSAPRLNLKSSKRTDLEGAPLDSPATGTVVPPSPSGDPLALRQLPAGWVQAVRELVSKTEDVGSRFSQEALAMHHGELPRRDIRGQATPEQLSVLLEEGVDVLPLPSLPALKETFH